MTEVANSRTKYDLEDRTARFGEMVIKFARKVPRDPITQPLISQIVRLATSVGANYCEADDAHTKREFRHRICLCKKETRETMHWFRMMVAASPPVRDEARRLWTEAKQLHSIFVAIIRTARKREQQPKH